MVSVDEILKLVTDLKEQNDDNKTCNDSMCDRAYIDGKDDAFREVIKLIKGG